MNTEVITADGIRFVITYKNMKNMRMRLMPDNTVAVSVPQNVTRSQLDGFLAKGVSWAKGAIAKKGADVQTAERDPNEPLRLIYHLGKKIPIEYTESDENSVSFEDDRICVRCHGYPQRDTLVNAIKQIQRRKFSEMLPSLTAECEKMAHISPYEWRIRDMKTKWGTCNTADRRIWLRLGLVSYPPECIKAVMIHELTHLYERGHNRRFYALMDEFYPENAEPNNILKKNLYDWW